MKKKISKVILSIAGSDNSSGAGVQCDIKAASALNFYCVNCISTITSQNSEGVNTIHVLPKKIIISQLEALFNEFKIDCIKIGLVGDNNSAEAIVNLLKKKKFKIPIVVDPIFKSSTNSFFVNKNEYLLINKTFKQLNPIFTPNLTEMKTLIDIKNIQKISKENLIIEFYKKYKCHVVLTSGDGTNNFCEDFLFDENHKVKKITAKKITTSNSHGSGCTFSTALCINLAKNFSLYDSVLFAKKFTEKSLILAPNLGLKYGPVGH